MILYIKLNFNSFISLLTLLTLNLLVMNKKQFEQISINQAISNDLESAIRNLSNLIGFATRLCKFDQLDELCTKVDALADEFCITLKNTLPDEE